MCMDSVIMVSPLGLFSRQASHQMLCPYHNNYVHHYRQTFQYYSDRVGNDLGVPPSNDGCFTVLILSQYRSILRISGKEDENSISKTVVL